MTTNNQQQIKAVIFDLGRVLVNLDFSSLLQRLFDDHATTDSFTRFEQMRKDEIAQQYGRGEIDPTTFHKTLCQKYNIQIDYEAFTRVWCNVFSPKQDMFDLVQQLLGNFPVGLLSDTDPLHWQYIKNSYPVIASIPNPTLSFEIGALKPNPQTYHAAANNVATPIANCLFIDDLEENVKGAQQAGMQSIQMQSPQQIHDCLTQAGIM